MSLTLNDIEHFILLKDLPLIKAGSIVNFNFQDAKKCSLYVRTELNECLVIGFDIEFWKCLDWFKPVTYEEMRIIRKNNVYEYFTELGWAKEEIAKLYLTEQ